MNLASCTKEQLRTLFRGYYAKYLSQHNDNRHYIIKYNENNTFTNSTFENNVKIGTSSGIYFYINKNDQCLINIQYQKVFPSPNPCSTFHKQNIFYPKLSNYTLGPFYTTLPNKPVSLSTLWLPVLYNNVQRETGFKVLHFYKKTDI